MYEALLGVLGNREKRPFISGEHGNKGQTLREKKEHKKTNFRFWGNRYPLREPHVW